MRKLAFLLACPLVASVALAQEPPPGQQPQPDRQQPMAQQPMAPDTKELVAQVVSTDPVGKTITIKRDPAQPGETTLPVEADAVATLKTVKPGEKVKLVCRTSGGRELAVTNIKKSEDKPKTNPQE